MTRTLTLPQHQAYQGARSFYLCFLPFVLCLLCLHGLMLEGAIFTWRILEMCISYGLAVWMYLWCCGSDTTVQGTSLGQAVEEGESMGEIGRWGSQPRQTVSALTYPPRHACSICKLVLPYRCRHCPKCQCCIVRYDHHCFWLGNCVGLHNHRQFYLFLLLQSLNNLSVALALLHLLGYPAHPAITIALYILLAGALGFLLFTGYLSLYHTMLICTGMTTWQHMARSKITYLNYLPAGCNPFSRGVWGNVREFWAATGTDWRVPSYEQARDMHPQCSLIDNQYYSCC